MFQSKKRGIHIPPGRHPWPHEMHTAEVLALAGHYVEFLTETALKSPDIRIDDTTDYEIKSPETELTRSIEQTIRIALRQSPNIIIDACRLKMRDDKAIAYLTKKCREQKQIKRMLYISKKNEIIDIFGLI